MMSRNKGILNFGDRFASGKTYEGLLIEVVHKVIYGNVPATMECILEGFGCTNEDDFEDSDLWIRGGVYSREDGEAHSTYFITTAQPGIEESGYSSLCLYSECTMDADDPGFIGDWELNVSIPIKALCRREDGKLLVKRTSMNIIFRDAVALLTERIGAIDYQNV